MDLTPVSSKKIRFTEHALRKKELLEKHGIRVEIGTIGDVIKFPEKIETGYRGRIIAQKRLSTSHVLRVIYEEHSEESLVITFYPGKRERYEKD